MLFSHVIIHTVHLHNELIRGLLQNVLGSGAAGGSGEVMEPQILPASSSSIVVDNGKDPRSKASGAAVIGDGNESSDNDEEEEEDKARCQSMYELFHQTFGRSSSLWDVWGPMRGKQGEIMCVFCHESNKVITM